MVDFPALCPTRRTFTPGEYPTRRFTAINGAGRTRLFGSRAFDATLELEYVLNDEDLAALLSCYHEARGSFDELVLDSAVLGGIGDSVRAEIPDYLTWRWESMPTVNSLLPGRSRVRVKLIATLDD